MLVNKLVFMGRFPVRVKGKSILYKDRNQHGPRPAQSHSLDFLDTLLYIFGGNFRVFLVGYSNSLGGNFTLLFAISDHRDLSDRLLG